MFPWPRHQRQKHETTKKTNSSNDKKPTHIDFRNPSSWVIAVLALTFVVFLGWREGIAIAFAVMSMFFATYFASKSLSITNRSLQLTMAVSKPFLNVQLDLFKGVSLDRAILIAEIENTGNLPADQVAVDCSWYIGAIENTEQCSVELEKPSQSIIFPAETAKSTYLIKGSEDVGRLTRQGSRVKVTVNYQNKLTGQQHTTKRTFRIAFASAAPSFNAAQTIVIPEEDYWD